METSWILCSIFDWIHNLNSIFHPWGVLAATATQQSHALLHKCPWKSDRKCRVALLQVLKPHPSPRALSTQAVWLLPWGADCLGCWGVYQGSLFSTPKEQKMSLLHWWSAMTTPGIPSQPSMYIYFPSDVSAGSGILQLPSVFSNAEDKNGSVDTNLRGTGGWHFQHVLHGTNPECFRGSSGGSVELEMPRAAPGGVQTFSPGCCHSPKGLNITLWQEFITSCHRCWQGDI